MKPYTMDPEIGEHWAEELESGRYKKGRGALRAELDDGTVEHCCLGVLCDMHRQATGRGEWDGERYVLDGKPTASVLPDEVVEWAGIEGSFAHNPEIDGTSLAAWNDGSADLARRSLPFDEIAGLIREHLL